MTTPTIERKRLDPATKAMPIQHRAFNLNREAINEAERTVELAFSSETPYERWFGTEILDHQKGAIRMGRMSNGAALLMDHNMRDQVGVIERAWIGDDRVARAIVRFSRSARASEIFTDIVDGIRSQVSVGYAVHEMVLEKSTDEMDTYRVTDWEPYEISIVSIPADPTVGVGRAADTEPTFAVRVINAVPPGESRQSPQGVVHMEVKENAPAGDIAGQHAISPDNIRKLEQARAAGLAKLGEQNAIDAGVVRGWIEAGKTVNEAAGDVVSILEKRAKDDVLIGKLDMSKKEVQAYSMLRAIGAVCDKNWQHAGLELEAHKEMEKRLGRGCKSNNAFFVPFDVQARGIDMNDERIEREVARRMRYLGLGKRDLTVGTSNAGGYLVGTQNQGFIELLRNNTVLYAMGARRLGGLTDNVTIPRQASGATPYWLATEATQITESQMVLGQIALTPKTVGAYTEISRQLTLQSNPDVESLVMVDLAAQVGIDIDAKGINGSGSSGQPTGLLGTSGIGSVTGGSLALAGVIEFQSDVFGANANLANAGYLTTGAVAGALMARVRIASTDSVTLWQGALESGRMEGKHAMASNQVPSATIIFGDFSEIVIAEWGVLEVDVNPFANFQAGIIGVRAISAIDVAVRQPGAFSVATSFS